MCTSYGKHFKTSRAVRIQKRKNNDEASGSIWVGIKTDEGMMDDKNLCGLD